MVMLRRLLLPMLRKHLGLCLAMAVVAAVGMAVLCGSAGARDSLERELYAYVEEYGYPDACIRFDLTEKETVLEAAAAAGVSEANTRAEEATLAKTAAGEYIGVNCVFYGTENFSKLYLWEGRLPEEGASEALIEYNAAEKNGIRVGDTLDVYMSSRYGSFTVTGIISAPEGLEESLLMSWGEKPELGSLYLREELLGNTAETGYCTQLLLKLDPSADPAAVLEAVCGALKAQGVAVTERYTFEESPVRARIENNVGPLRELSVITPACFFTIVLLVLYLCVTILVRKNRKTIGLTRALGFQKASVTLLFCGISLLIALTAVLLALPLSRLVLNLSCSFYRAYFPIPRLNGTLSRKTVLTASLLTLMITQLAAVIGAQDAGRITPMDAIRKLPAAEGKTPKLMQTLFRKADPAVKCSLTTLLRNPARLVFSVVCTAAVISVMYTVFNFKTSKDEVIRETLEDRFQFDILAFFEEDLTEADIEHICRWGAASVCEPLRVYQVTAALDGREISLPVYALRPGSELMRIPNVERLPDEGIVLDEYHADRLGAKKGDTIYIGSVPLQVAAISRQRACRGALLSMEQAERLSEAYYPALLLRSESLQISKRYLLQLDGLLNMSLTEQFRENAEKTYATYDFIVWIFAAFAAVIGVTVLSIINSTNLEERRRELCLLRAQGFAAGQIVKSWGVQLLVFLGFGILLGIPLGWRLSVFLLDRMETLDHSYYGNFCAEALLPALGLLAVTALPALLLSVYTLGKWNIAEELKTEE